jgi:hypothetical protein
MCTDHSDDYERRKQNRLRALGTQTPRCCLCPEDDWRCLELHHIEGQAHGETLAIVCRNCHRRLSDAQIDHPEHRDGDDPELSAIARFLLGLADMLELAVAKLREVAVTLLDRARGATATPQEA